MDYVRYLQSKVSVDDRAINETVLVQLEERLRSHACRASQAELVVVDIGAGIGAMLTRLRARRSFEQFSRVQYTLVDIKRDVLLAARESLQPSLQEGDKDVQPTVRVPVVSGGGAVHNNADVTTGCSHSLPSLSLDDGITVNFYVGDALAYLCKRPESTDLVVGAAVLDIFDPETALPIILNTLCPSGANCVYFPIMFDGVTHFFPPCDRGVPADDAVLAAFHLSMGFRSICRVETLAAQTARHIAPLLRMLGMSRVECGASAWVVAPCPDGSYIADEAHFVGCILDFIDATAQACTDDRFGPPGLAADVVACRRMQLSEGVLYYTAHNLDVFAVR